MAQDSNLRPFSLLSDVIFITPHCFPWKLPSTITICNLIKSVFLIYKSVNCRILVNVLHEQIVKEAVIFTRWYQPNDWILHFDICNCSSAVLPDFLVASPKKLRDSYQTDKFTIKMKIASILSCRISYIILPPLQI